MKSIKETFYELVDEAKDGKVILDDEPFNIVFNTIVEDDKSFFNDENKQSLIIDDMDLFLIKLSLYVDLELEAKRRMMPISKDIEDNKVKTIIANLFVNASYKDFTDPVRFIEKRIDFLKDKTFSNYDNGVVIPLGEELLNSNLHIVNEVDSIHSETPNKMTFYLEKDGDKYYLPSINYGISGNTCYIYSMMNKNEGKNKDSKFAKDINRILYKLNDGVEETDEFKEYVENGREGYYPDNITDVSLPFVFASSMFLNMLNEKGIKSVEVVSFLPVRYDSRDLSSTSPDMEERNDRIQNNATNKLIRTFNRVLSHIDGVTVTANPFDADENMHMRIDDNIVINNELLDSKVR